MSFIPAEPLLAADDIFSMSAIMIGLAWFGIWLDGTWLGKKTSGVVWVIIIGTVLSNFRIIPFESPVFSFIGGYLVPLSIPLLLFKANLMRIFRESGPVIVAFGIASIGTLTGVLVGYFLLDLGDIGPKVAGVYTGGWIGGSVNFVAVSQAVQMTPDEFAVAIGASAGVSIAGLMILLALPTIPALRKFIPSQIIDETEKVTDLAETDADRIPFKLTHVSGALAASFAICAISYGIAEVTSLQRYSILFVTLLAIVIANVFPQRMQKFDGDFELGIFAMYVFFAAIGAGTDAVSFIESAPILLVYGIVILVVHLFVVIVGAKLFKIDLAQAVIGSGAAFVGAGPTAAIATAHGWKQLVTPGIMCGVLGYVIATFIGVALSGMLGGLG
ncbi:MAG: membrane protein [Hyphococcus sp.]|nr:MAG: membrane protein [Marinicaulis sp.]